MAAVADDGAAEAVMSRASELASALGAKLFVLHVVEDTALIFAEAMSQGAVADLRPQLVAEAEKTLARLKATPGGKVSETRVEMGTPHEVILRVADQIGAAIIVTGPGTPQNLREKVLGSTADRVVRAATLPVLVVRRHAAGAYRRVAAAVDVGASAALEPVLSAALRVAPEADIEVLHFAGVPRRFEEALRRTATSEAEISAFREARRRAAKQELSRLMKGRTDRQRMTLSVRTGEPARALVRLSRSPDVDLVVLGPHAHNAVMRTLLGSVAQTVLRSATCDVLIARN